jgi:hypothetical protein
MTAIQTLLTLRNKSKRQLICLGQICTVGSTNVLNTERHEMIS